MRTMGWHAGSISDRSGCHPSYHWIHGAERVRHDSRRIRYRVRTDIRKTTTPATSRQIHSESNPSESWIRPEVLVIKTIAPPSPYTLPPALWLPIGHRTRVRRREPAIWNGDAMMLNE